MQFLALSAVVSVLLAALWYVLRLAHVSPPRLSSFAGGWWLKFGHKATSEAFADPAFESPTLVLAKLGNSCLELLLALASI